MPSLRSLAHLAVLGILLGACKPQPAPGTGSGGGTAATSKSAGDVSSTIAVCAALVGEVCAAGQTELSAGSPVINVTYVTASLPRPGQTYSVAWIAEDVGKAAPPNFQILESKIPFDAKSATRASAPGRYVVSGRATRPTAGWPPGRYRVEVRLAGAPVASARFALSRTLR